MILLLFLRLFVTSSTSSDTTDLQDLFQMKTPSSLLILTFCFFPAFVFGIIRTIFGELDDRSTSTVTDIHGTQLQGKLYDTDFLTIQILDDGAWHYTVHQPRADLVLLFGRETATMTEYLIVDDGYQEFARLRVEYAGRSGVVNYVGVPIAPSNSLVIPQHLQRYLKAIGLRQGDHQYTAFFDNGMRFPNVDVIYWS